MILIITEKFDPHVDFVIEELDRQGIDYHRLIFSDFPTQLSVSLFNPQTEHFRSMLLHRSQKVHLDEIKTVWYRRTEKIQLPDTLSEEDKVIANAECQAMLKNLWQTLKDRFWVSTLESMRLASSKAEQLQRAMDYGFNILPTCFSNRPESIKDFYASLTPSYQLIYKPHSSVLIPQDNGKMGVAYTAILDLKHLEKLQQIVTCPGIFQAYLEKKYDIRVTIFGDQVFACKIYSQAHPDTQVDSRASRWETDETPKHEAMELPPEIKTRCLEITHSYGLQYAAIDLAIGQDGQYYFFELNPNGQWAWIEELTAQPMRAALIQLLTNNRQEEDNYVKRKRYISKKFRCATGSARY